MAHTKEEWRQLLMDARRALGVAVRTAHSRAIVAQVASRAEFVTSRALLVYVPIGAEVDPMPLTRDAHATGKAVYCPHGDAGEPQWRRYQPEGGSDTAASETSAPVVTPREMALLVVVPGTGFDLDGVRLGRGRGFYDRALANLRRAVSVFAVGVGFEAQVVRRLPCDPWDQRVDLVVTEQRCIVPRASLDPPRARRQAEEVHEP